VSTTSSGPLPPEWATTTEWPIRLKLGSHTVHAAANFLLANLRHWPWTACGRPLVDHHTSMPKDWPVTCRTCNREMNR
jgi:hypothetical protein